MSDLKKPPEEVLTRLLGEGDNLSTERASGGLSGATIWRVATAGQVFSIRHWPKAIADPSWIERTAQILQHAHTHGAPFLPQPIGPPYLSVNGDWWEATTWCPGTPELVTKPLPLLVQAATEALAKFHLAGNDFSIAKGPSPAILQRAALLESCIDRIPRSQAMLPAEWRDVAQRLAGCLPPLVKIAQPWVRRFVEVVLPLQPVQIDSRPEHFLFTGDTVTGLIDFGAMRIDTRAVDVARLTGELAKGDRHQRDVLVELYNTFTEEPVDVRLVEALDASGAVLAAVNWLGWLASGRALLHDPAALRHRLENLAERTERLAGLH